MGALVDMYSLKGLNQLFRDDSAKMERAEQTNFDTYGSIRSNGFRLSKFTLRPAATTLGRHGRTDLAHFSP
jgi:hypothetical protein